MNNQSFNTKRIAEGYAKDRPYLHPQVMEVIRKDLSLTGSFQNGLDLGCGAGLSTRALKALCENVTGTDISEEMIQVAKAVCRDASCHFYACKAEEVSSEIPYDIVTAAGMVQWVEQSAFLQNLNHCMTPGGYLVIYDFWITDEMQDVAGYQDWWQHSYLPKFPKPYRKENIWTNAEVMPLGFSMERQKPLHLTWEFELDAFVRFMMIQSNVNEQIAKSNLSEEAAGEWLRSTLAPLFSGQKRTLGFTGYIWYLKKENTMEALKK